MIKQKVEEVALNVRGIDPKLRYAFKGVCAEFEIGMRDAIIHMLEHAVETSQIGSLQKPDTGTTMPDVSDHEED